MAYKRYYSSAELYLKPNVLGVVNHKNLSDIIELA